MSEQECLNEDIEYVQRKIEYLNDRMKKLTSVSADIRGHKTNEHVRKFEVKINRFEKLLEQMKDTENKSNHIHECNISTEIKPTDLVNDVKPKADEAYLI